MEQNHIEDKIKNIVIAVLNLGPNADITGDTNLIETYHLSSIDALELLVYLEEEFDIHVEDDDLSVDMLKDISSLAKYVTQHLNIQE